MLILSDLTVEYRTNPRGLDTSPRFSWKLISDRKETVQISYRILVNDSEGENVWDSGVVEEAQSVLIDYDGNALKPMAAYTWHVSVCDNHSQEASGEGIFETGLLNPEKNFIGSWITYDALQIPTDCPVYETTIRLAEGSAGSTETAVGTQATGSAGTSGSAAAVESARAYVTALGVYDLLINGVKVHDTYMSPGWTSYEHTVQYQTYDITEYLKEEDTISIPTAPGWYAGCLNGEGKNHFYGDKTAVRAMLVVRFTDGTTRVYGTGTDWTVRDGVIRTSEIYHGEMQELRSDHQIWNQTSACLLPEDVPVGSLVGQQSEPVRVTKTMPAVRKMITPEGDIVLDFGQNLTGWVEVTLPPLRDGSDHLTIRHAETLDRNGNFYTTNLRTAKDTDRYYYGAAQEGSRVHPHFTWRGFRYIAVSGVGPADIRTEDFTACVLHSDMPRTGIFSCDNPLVDKLAQNIVWTQADNSVDIPSDCPQRDERLGWTGDAEIFCATAEFNYMGALFYRKWLRDVASETDDEHGVPHVVPNIVGPSVGTSVWSDCATVVPWTTYQTYGDQKALRESYPLMKQWVEYIRRQAGDGVLWLGGFQRGDWLALDGDESLHTLNGGTDKDLLANAYYARSVQMTADAARVLGYEEDVTDYSRLYTAIKEAINEEYVTKKGRLVSETQTACVLLLHFDLLREEYRPRVKRTLRENLKAHKGHLTCGFIGTSFLCQTLSANGMHEEAENLLLNEDYPGWLYAVKQGATTIWERWNSVHEDGTFDESGMNSLNHYTYGSIGYWLYHYVGGIQASEPGYRRMVIKPYLTKGITEADCSYESMYGRIRCHWICRDHQIHVDITIPANTAAVVILPEKEEKLRLGSGSYSFEYDTQTDLRPAKFSGLSTFAEIAADPQGREALETYMPHTVDGPAWGFLKNQTPDKIASMGQGVMADAVQRFIRALGEIR